MTEITESGALETWSTPSCPFTIEYSRRVLDDIRLAVVDAFFSLPRGGAEIGGVLLGKFADGRLTIQEYTPLECDHIFGPSFTLSPGDHGRLAEILSEIRGHMSDIQPVGWYHSHTRSDIFLSDADLDIHNRYFPEPWQVALVLRPSTFQPVQAGFFFREPDGSVHTRASYQEFALDPLPVGQVPRGMPAPAPQPIHRQAEPEGPVITLMADRMAPHAEPEPTPSAVAEVVAAPVTEPAPPQRATLLPPALPPLPRLELVPDPSELAELPLTAVPEEAVAKEEAGAKHDAEVATDEPEPPKEFAAVSEVPGAVEVAPALVEVETPAAKLAELEPPVALTELVALTEPEPLAAAIPPVPEGPSAEPPAQIAPVPTAEIQAAPPAEPRAERPAAEPPSFLQVEPVRSRRRLWVVGTLAAAIVIGAAGYQERDALLPQLMEMMPKRAAALAPVAVPLTLPLSTSDQQGQLQIQWDGAARAVTEARDGLLQVTDDGATIDLPLDAAHLKRGEFTYLRSGEHVDARLTLQELDGTQVRTVTSFYGALPQPAKLAGADPAARKENSELAKKNADLTKENGDLQQRVGELSKQTTKLKADLAALAAAGKQNAELAQKNADIRQQRDDLLIQTAKLKSDGAAALAASGKQNAELAQKNAELRQQRDDLAKQTAKLKADLAAAHAASNKPTVDLAPKDAQTLQQRDDLLIQIAKLKTDLAAQAGASKQNPLQSADFSKQRYALINRVSQLESDLAVANARADRVTRQLEDLKKQQLQRRLQNQSGDPSQ